MELVCLIVEDGFQLLDVEISITVKICNLRNASRDAVNKALERNRTEAVP
jgi:hypothetical protein